MNDITRTIVERSMSNRPGQYLVVFRQHPPEIVCVKERPTIPAIRRVRRTNPASPVARQERKAP